MNSLLPGTAEFILPLTVFLQTPNNARIDSDPQANQGPDRRCNKKGEAFIADFDVGSKNELLNIPGG